MVLVVKCLICKEELTYTQNDPSELVKHVRENHPKAAKKSEVNQPLRERSEQDLRESLKLNSVRLKKLCDKEAQTEIVASYFVNMSQRKSKNSAGSVKSLDLSSTQPLSPPPKTASSPARISLDKGPSERTPLKVPTPTDQTSPRQSVQLTIGKHARASYVTNQANQQSSPPNRTNKASRKFYKTSIEKWQPIGDEKIHCPRCQSHKRPIVRTQTDRVTDSSFMNSLLMTCWPLCMSPCLFPEPTLESLHCPICNLRLGVYDHQKKQVVPSQDVMKSP